VSGGEGIAECFKEFYPVGEGLLIQVCWILATILIGGRRAEEHDTRCPSHEFRDERSGATFRKMLGSL
jgi:hypothetical protein